MASSSGGRPSHDLRKIARRAMMDRGFDPDFSPATLREVDQAENPPVAAADPDGDLQDLRHLLWSSVDNDDSLDLDQLAVAEERPGGVTRILVAIADVDALVRTGSSTDGHAAHNTTSVYTAAQVFSMLPERLSTDLTSLADRAERRALIVQMDFSTDGRLVDSALMRAWVKNRAKLAYGGVAAFLDGRGPLPGPAAAVDGMEGQLRIQDRVAQALRRRRHQRGALRLETLEPRAVFESGVFADLRIDPKNRAKELIEDFMIAANGVTARYLESQGFPSLRRVLRAPKRWDRIVQLAAERGQTLPKEPESGALEDFLQAERTRAPEQFSDLSLSIVKLMGSGEYGVERPGGTTPGHFGLSVRDYAHSTAPNRRFPDLITQRLLKAALDGRRPPYDEEQLEELARHCTIKEDDANKVERQVRKSAAALLLSGRWGQRFPALVTGASDKGTWVRILTPPVEGRVVDGCQGWDVGEKVTVELVRTDVERGHIDFRGCGRGMQAT